jgi:alkylhydroperoxidase/carboxymuconolactone decarboxylase family protein YurZ
MTQKKGGPLSDGHCNPNKDEIKVMEAFRKGKKGADIIKAWVAGTPGAKVDHLVAALERMLEKRPELLYYYANEPYAAFIERGILDRKTRELIMLGVLMAMEDQLGVDLHVSMAMATGATEEEMWEVAGIVVYEKTKKAIGSHVMLSMGLDRAEKDKVKFYNKG